jgi:hypothetical protein
MTIPAAVVGLFVVLGMCWAITTPPGGGVDEPSHYVRMVGLAQGDLFGDPVPLDTPFGNLTGDQLVRVNSEGGLYLVPGAKREPLPCNAFEVTMSYSCAQYPVTAEPQVHPSYHARYLPGSYLLPAVFSRLGDTTWKALVAGRVGFVVQNAVLLWVAAVALAGWARRYRSVSTGPAVVLALSITPLLMFLSGTLSPSSTEIIGVAACAAALMRAIRDGSSRWLWAATVCGSVATWSRDLGGPAVVLAVIVVALLEPGWRERLRERRSSDVAAWSVLALAVVGAQVWQALNKASMTASFGSLGQVWARLGEVAVSARDSLGLVGWLVVPMDSVAELLWTVLLVVGVAMAALRLPPRAKAVAAALVLVYVLAGVVLSSSMKASGFGFQGRYLLPVAAVLVMVLVGYGSTGQLRWGWARVALAVAAIGQFSTLLVSARRNAIGLNGSAMDFARASWEPPFGWWPLLSVAALACIGLAALGLPSQIRARAEAGAIDSTAQ